MIERGIKNINDWNQSAVCFKEKYDDQKLDENIPEFHRTLQKNLEKHVIKFHPMSRTEDLEIGLFLI